MNGESSYKISWKEIKGKCRIGCEKVINKSCLHEKAIKRTFDKSKFV